MPTFAERFSKLLEERDTILSVGLDPAIPEQRNKNTILVAIGTEKILNEDRYLTKIINTNIGYPDGIGCVLAIRRKGFKAVKIRGAQLWLEIIKNYYLLQYVNIFF